MPEGTKNVQYIIAVGSGKGGVGKSTVSANLAAALKQHGFRVGLVDMDIYGPSVGKMFGIPGRTPLQGIEETNAILPLELHGLKIMSFSFLLEEGQAVAWRGPLLNGAVNQLLNDVEWGELDYLIIDLPPGTGDVQLTLTQNASLAGAVVVSTPQSVALADATRAIDMFQKVNVPILGIIENMSEYVCPKCGHISHIFHQHGGEQLSETYGAPLLGQIPLQTEIMDAGEAGIPIVMREPEGPIAERYAGVVKQLREEVKKYN